MSKQVTSTLWFVRITAPHSHCETKLKEMCEWIDLSGYAVGYHVGAKTAKPHIHLVITMLKTLQRQSLDVRLKKLFEVKGSDYSSKVWDGNHKALSYLYHDVAGKVEYFRMTLSPEELAAVKHTADTYREIVTEAKTKASTRIPDRILEEMGGDVWTERQIITRIYQGVRNRDWYDPGPLLDRYVNEIMLRSDEENVKYFTELAVARRSPHRYY